jgi:hypothetical protein
MIFEGNIDSLKQMCQTRIEIRVDKKSSFEPQNPAENPDLAHYICHMYDKGKILLAPFQGT